MVAREEPAGDGVCEMTPQPNLLADPSMPRQRRGFVGALSGEGFFVGMLYGRKAIIQVTSRNEIFQDETSDRRSTFDIAPLSMSKALT